MSERPGLRSIKDETPALSREEVNRVGNELVSKARQAAVEAIGQSMVPEFVARSYTVNRAGILAWRSRARSAREAWQRVDDLLSEVLHELDKTLIEERKGMRLAVLPDGKPGHFRTEWVPDPQPSDLSTKEGD